MMSVGDPVGSLISRALDLPTVSTSSRSSDGWRRSMSGWVAGEGEAELRAQMALDHLADGLEDFAIELVRWLATEGAGERVLAHRVAVGRGHGGEQRDLDLRDLRVRRARLERGGDLMGDELQAVIAERERMRGGGPLAGEQPLGEAQVDRILEPAEQLGEQLARAAQRTGLAEPSEHALAERADPALEHGLDHAGVAAEVVADQRVADARLARDLLEADLIGLELDEDALGGIEDLDARLVGRASAALRLVLAHDATLLACLVPDLSTHRACGAGSFASATDGRHVSSTYLTLFSV